MNSNIDEIFSEWGDNYTPGCVLGVIKDGELVYNKGYGYANLEYDIKLSPDSVFRLASVSKQFTAACIAILHLRDELSLDDKLSKYFPEMNYDKGITIRHLIHHTSGIKDYLNGLIIANYTSKDIDNIEETDLISFLTKIEGVNFSPGESFSYSNSGYFLLGQLVKRLTGKTLRDFAKQEIFDPLGMHNTHYHDNYREIVKNRASGYAKSENEFQISMTNCDIVGDGAVFSNVSDLIKWDQNFYHKKLGGNELISLLQSLGEYDFENNNYAFGLSVAKHKGLTTISHGGGFVGFRTYMTRFPEYNISIIVLANLASIEPFDLAYKVADLYLSEKYVLEEVAIEATEPNISEPRHSDILDSLKPKIGIFINKEKYQYLSLEIRDEKFIVNPWDLRFELTQIDENSYYSNDPFELELKFDAEHLLIDGIFGKGNLKKIIPYMLNVEDYVGNYVNSSFNVEYTVSIKEKNLSINMKGLDNPKLTNVGVDLFFANGHFFFEFLRKDRIVTGCIIGSERARNFEFIRYVESSSD